MQIDWVAGLTILAPIVTALLVARLERLRYQNLKLREGLNEQKRDFYFDLINTLQKMFSDEWDDTVEGDSSKKVRELFEKCYYYSSTNVLKSFGDLMQHLYAADDLNDNTYDTLRAKKLLAELIVKIRKDLGHSTFWSNESWIDISRLNIKDIMDYVPQEYRKDRSGKTQPQMRFKKRKIT